MARKALSFAFLGAAFLLGGALAARGSPRIWRTSQALALIESTIQATRGNSGSPLYGDFDGRRHLVIGMHQGSRGNGIDVSQDTPNIQIFFTLATLTSIHTAQAATPCP